MGRKKDEGNGQRRKRGGMEGRWGGGRIETEEDEEDGEEKKEGSGWILLTINAIRRI